MVHIATSDPTRSGPTRTTDPTPGPTRLARVAPIVAPALLMLGLGIWGLGRPSMFGSEAEAYWAARLPLRSLFHLLGHVDAVHGTYYLTAHVWLSIDASPTGLRALSVLAMTGAVAMTSVIAGRLSGSRRIGVIAGLVLALSPSVNGWAQSGRPYALVTFAVTVLVWTLLRAVEPPGRSWPRWLAFGAMTVVCGYLHEMTLLLLPAFALTLLWARARGAVQRRWALVTSAAVVLVVPLLVISSHEAQAVGHLRAPGRAALILSFHQNFGRSDAVAWVLVALTVVGAVTGLRARTRGVLTTTMLAVPLLVVPLTILFLESRYGKPLFDNRYVLYGTVGAAILTAVGLDRIGTLAVARIRVAGRGAARLAVVPAVLVGLFVAVVQFPTQQAQRTADGHHENYRAASTFLAAHARRGDGVVFTSGVAHSAQLGYPAAFVGLIDLAQKADPQRSGTFFGQPVPDSAVRAALLAHPRIWAVGPYETAHIPHATRVLRDVLATDFRPAVVRRFAGVTDVLWVRRGLG